LFLHHTGINCRATDINIFVLCRFISRDGTLEREREEKEKEKEKERAGIVVERERKRQREKAGIVLEREKETKREGWHCARER